MGVTRDNSTVLRGNYPFIYNTDGPPDASKTKYYESAATRIWPIALIQSPKGTFEGGAGGMQSNMSCLKAMNATAGSQPIKEVPGAGSRLQFGVWALVATGAAALLL